MRSIQEKAWRGLTYYPARQLMLAGNLAFSQLPPMRQRDLDSLRQDRVVRDIDEERRCAIFCLLWGSVIGQAMEVAAHEAEDYDYVARHADGDGFRYFPVQMKRVAPERLDPATSMQQAIGKLSKYTDAANLVVAMHLDRAVFLEPSQLDVTGLRVGQLWLFGRSGERWLLMGDLMSINPRTAIFPEPL